MLREEDNNKDRVTGGGGNRRAYLRSVSWTDRSPNKPNPIRRPQPNSKARSLLPPLQPLSINRRPVEQWPKAGSDDLGVWSNPQTPRGSIQALESSILEQQPVREFEFKRDKLAFFDKECSRIADHIYLGSDAVAKNREILRQNGITHVLNCVGFVCPEYFKSDLVYKTLWLQDSPSEDITSILYDVFDYFEDVREQGGRVFVHCCQGVSRSTSLVIAYLMWREGQSFEDALKYVKAARGVTNPNMGFACQLLLCQKRVHAMPASPNSMLRIYRMAPHSSYDPLHVVPKMLNHPGTEGFDTRGAFIVHVPSAIYVWIGKNCNSVMSNKAREAANQVIRYERAQGPMTSIKEGEETSEFWDAIARGQFFADDCDKEEIKNEEVSFSGSDKIATMMHVGVGERKVNEYDLDFELFHKALAGGVVPPFSISNSGSETCLPARENGWCRLRRKFVNGIMKEFVSSKKNCSTAAGDESDMIIDTGKESEDAVSLTGFASPSSPPADLCGSPDSFDCFPNASPNRISDTRKEVGSTIPFSYPLLPLTPPRGLPDYFSCFRGNSPQLSSKSPTLSPSTSDYSSSFTFSPSSCNWSDFSRQPSPSGIEGRDSFYGRYTSLADNSHSPCEETASSPTKVFSADHTSGVANFCLPCKGNFPSIAERRGSNPPPRLLPSAGKPSIAPRNLVRSWSFSLPDSDNDEVEDIDDNQIVHEGDMEELMLDADIACTGDDSQYEIKDKKEINKVCFSSGTIDKIAEVATPELYQWPALNKVEIYSFQILDSRSVYILLAPEMSLGTNETGILYVWLGREALSEKDPSQLISHDHPVKDGHLRLENISHNIINQMGLPMDASVEIVREGEEPEQFWNHLNCFSFQKEKYSPNH